jgi:3-dehydroquinate synthase
MVVSRVAVFRSVSMNKFKIDNTNLFYPESNDYQHLNFEITSTPKKYFLKGFENVADICDILNMKLSNQGCLVIDSKVFEIYFKKNIKINKKRIFKVDATESVKNIETVLSICEFYAKNNINKGSDIYVIGGGILQDLGGSASYLFKRGVPWSYLPSTLLGISDSCLGGKTAVNFKTYKNLLGLFSAPREVILCSDFIKSLSDQDLSCGYGEIFRLSLTGGKNSFEVFKKNIDNALNGKNIAIKNLIITSLLVKRAVIEEDEYEINIRKSMNYGHTIGHALEAVTNFNIPHGIAVAIGILIENDLSKSLGLMNDILCEEILDSAKKIIHPKYIKLLAKSSFSNISEHLRKDKKTIGNKANFTYLKSLGNMQFAYNDIDDTNQQIQKSIDYIVNELSIE